LDLLRTLHDKPRAVLVGGELPPVLAADVNSWVLTNGLCDEIEYYLAEDIDAEPLPNKGVLVLKTLYKEGKTIQRATIIATGPTNDCWKRFILVKELMHLFDEVHLRARSPVQVAALANALIREDGEFYGDRPSGDDLLLYAEQRAAYRALQVLVPCHHLRHMKKLRASHELDDHDVALWFRIPERFVSKILAPTFEEDLAKAYMYEPQASLT
jgi:hypothetical protein